MKKKKEGKRRLREVITIRVNEEEKDYMKEMANKNALSLGRFCREMIFQGISSKRLREELNEMEKMANTLKETIELLKAENEELKKTLEELKNTEKMIVKVEEIDINKVLEYLEKILSNPDEYTEELNILDNWLSEKNLRLEDVRVLIGLKGKKIQIVNKHPGLYLRKPIETDKKETEQNKE